PNRPDFAMPEVGLGADMDPQRLGQRRALAAALVPGARTRQLQDLDAFQARAFDLLTSPATQEAFRIDREPNRLRDSYGRNIYGQRTLLARRLLEAGTRAVCLSWAPCGHAT